MLAYYGNVSEGKCKTSCYDCEIIDSLTGLSWECVSEGRCKDIILQDKIAACCFTQSKMCLTGIRLRKKNDSF